MARRSVPHLQWLTVLVLCSGCSLGEPYTRPTVPLPETWQTSLAEMRAIARPHWWEIFDDPKLSAVLEESLRGNQDLLTSAASVDELMARFAAARSNQLPQVDLSASVQRTRKSLAGFTGGLLSSSRTSTVSDLSFQASWEIDLWGRLENATEASRAQLLAQESTRRGVVLSLVSSVASTYVRLRQADRLLEISRETVQSRLEAMKLTKTRFAGGMTSELDIRQAESELATAETTIPRFERQVAQSANLLRALQGLVPGSIERGRPLKELSDVRELPASLPMDLLENRPDIRAAEERLMAAHAEIAVARAAYFPNLSLTALFGLSSADLDTWIDGRSRTWSVGPSLLGPLFSAGRIEHQVEAATAQQEQALHAYRQSIVQALREVEDALVGYETTRRELDTREKQVNSLRAYLRLATTRYDGGQSSYLDVLDAQRALFQGQLDLAQTQGDVALALIQVYRVLGGGWITDVSPGRELPPETPKLLPRIAAIQF